MIPALFTSTSSRPAFSATSSISSAERVALADVTDSELSAASGFADFLDQRLERISGSGDRHHMHAVGGELKGDGASEAHDWRR